MSPGAAAHETSSSRASRWTDGAKHLLAFARRQKGFKLALLSVLLIGTWLRLRGYILDPPTLWLDEAFWAMRILEKPITECKIRPVGFVYLTKWLVLALGATEPAYRALPFFASLAGLWLMPYVVGRLIRNRWVAFLAVLVFALHPVAIEMGVEFKHYGLEMGVFMALLAAYLYHRSKKTPWSLTLLVVSAWLSFMFSLAVIFLYPALFALTGLEALYRRQWRRLFIVVGGTLASLATVLAVYLVIWQRIAQARHERHWGHFYNVFYLESEPRNRDTTKLGWTVSKYAALAAVAGDGRVKDSGDTRAQWQSAVLDQEVVDDLSALVGWVWFGLHVAGIWCLLRRRKYDWLLLLWSPILLVVAFNLLGRWPGGNFRVNTFYVPYSVVLAMVGLDWVFARGTTRRRWPLPARLSVPLRTTGPLIAALIVLPALWLRPSWQPKAARWTESGSFREALQALAARRPPVSVRQTILLDNSSWRPWVYYLRYDVNLPEQTQQAVRQGFRPTSAWGGQKFLARFRRLAKTRKGRDFLIMMSKPHFYSRHRSEMSSHCKQLEETHIDDHVILRCVLPKG